MSGFFAFFVQEKAERVTWYNETKSVTHTHLNYRGDNKRAPPSRNSILIWVQNFEERGIIKIQSQSGRFSMISEVNKGYLTISTDTLAHQYGQWNVT